MAREKPTMPYIHGEPEGLGRQESEENLEERKRLEGNDPLRRRPKGKKKFLPHGTEEVPLSAVGEDQITGDDQNKLFGNPKNPHAYDDDDEDDDASPETERERELKNWELHENGGKHGAEEPEETSLRKVGFPQASQKRSPRSVPSTKREGWKRGSPGHRSVRNEGRKPRHKDKR